MRTLTPGPLAVCLALLAGSPFAPRLAAQEVVFSRRVYEPIARTYQQVWIWSARDGALRQLTRSDRNHEQPTCSPDGSVVFFHVPTEGVSFELWRIDRATDDEIRIGVPVPESPPPGATPPLLREPVCDAGTVALSPDRTRAACAVHGEAIAIADLASGTIEDVPFEPRYSTGDRYPPWPLQSIWSPDGGTLLVGTYGENGSSTSHQLDYFLLDPNTKRWTRAMTGNDALWLPDSRRIVYTTPRDLVRLAPSSTRSVWSAQLAVYDTVAGRSTQLTSGVTNNVEPALCGGVK